MHYWGPYTICKIACNFVIAISFSFFLQCLESLRENEISGVCLVIRKPFYCCQQMSCAMHSCSVSKVTRPWDWQPEICVRLLREERFRIHPPFNPALGSIRSVYFRQRGLFSRLPLSSISSRFTECMELCSLSPIRH